MSGFLDWWIFTIKEQMIDAQQLLREYAEKGSDTAFRELVSRYVDLVYSAAIRMVNGDSHLAEDVTQTVFADLAKKSKSISPQVMLGGWLHRHTCFVSANTLRADRRRRTREREAAEMNDPQDHSPANLAAVAPVLDEAINQLPAEDRSAIMLRFFEQQDFRTVGEKLGSNEDAARKRVHRALEKLEVLLKHRGVALSATALASTLTTQAVTAAPAGLAATIATAAITGTATTASTLTILNIITMSKIKVGIVTAIVAAGIGIPLMMHRQAESKLRAENELLRQRAEQAATLEAENQRLQSLAARKPATPPSTNDQYRELMKLRGEVGALRKENQRVAETASAATKTNTESALSGLTANPEIKKLIRDQQKAGFTMMYKEFGKRLKLAPEEVEKLNDVLADNVMENINHITAVLREGKSPDEMAKVFASQDVALIEKLKETLGPEKTAQYQDYTRNLLSYLTSEQFKPMLTGEKAAKEEQTKQMYQLVQEETQAALKRAGLNPDYQVIPMLNFQNIASESLAEKNLGLLEEVFSRVSARSGGFLNPEEMKKFEEFRSTALNNNRAALVMNRKMMAPNN